jgi:hypothetical protein
MEKILNLMLQGRVITLKAKVNQFSLKGELVNTFESISLAQRTLNISNIRACIIGKQKTAGGYVWKYAA